MPAVKYRNKDGTFVETPVVCVTREIAGPVTPDSVGTEELKDESVTKDKLSMELQSSIEEITTLSEQYSTIEEKIASLEDITQQLNDGFDGGEI